MSKKVIFLDFDGVILTLRTALAHHKRGWSNAPPDPVACALLRRVCETGVRIVVSSTWRTDANNILGGCRSKLDMGGLTKFLHTDWRTDVDGENRPALIMRWMDKHPDVEDYRIIDDDSFKWTRCQEERWVKCSPLDGLGGEGMKALLEWVGITPKSTLILP